MRSRNINGLGKELSALTYGTPGAAYRAWLTDTRLPVLCYSSLGRGYLSGRFRTDGGKPIEECLNRAPILSPSSAEHIRENVAALDISLTQEECLWLHDGDMK